MSGQNVEVLTGHEQDISVKFHDSELINKEVVVLSNMEPATIRGVESQGMILATKDGDKMAVLVPEKEVTVGSKVS